jgi:hypothetical protein
MDAAVEARVIGHRVWSLEIITTSSGMTVEIGVILATVGDVIVFLGLLRVLLG